MSNTTIKLPTPHQAQQEIIASSKRFNVVVCGRRFGKSILGEDRIFPVALAGFPTAWFAPDFKSLLEVWRDSLRILQPAILRTDVQQKRIELTTGGLIEFWSLDDDPERCRGRKYKRIVIDEAAKVRQLELAWTQAIRPTLIDYIGDAWLLTTPRGRDFLWELWMRGQPGADEKWRNWKSWKMPTSANPHLPPSEIEDMQRELPRTVFNQEVLAEFLDVGGRFFDEWSEERDGSPWHVVLPFKVPKHWLDNAFGGLDYGTAAPFSFHLAVPDEDGDVLIIDEEYHERKLPREQAQIVRACIERNGADPDKVVIAADPSMFTPTDPAKRIGEYPIEAYWAEGLRCVKAVNDRLATNTRAKEYLHGARLKRDDQGEEYAKPHLRIFKGKCRNLIRTIPLMITSESDVEDFEHDHGEEDHAIDSGLRYALGSNRVRPSIAPIEDTFKIPKNLPPHIRKQLEDIARQEDAERKRRERERDSEN